MTGKDGVQFGRIQCAAFDELPDPKVVFDSAEPEGNGDKMFGGHDPYGNAFQVGGSGLAS
jgi:hypothetical protein